MEIFEKPPKMKLLAAALDFFTHNPHEMIVGLRTKEGGVLVSPRSPTGRPVKLSRAQADGVQV